MAGEIPMTGSSPPERRPHRDDGPDVIVPDAPPKPGPQPDGKPVPEHDPDLEKAGKGSHPDAVPPDGTRAPCPPDSTPA